MVAGALWEQAEKTGRLKAETKTVLPATSYSIGSDADQADRYRLPDRLTGCDSRRKLLVEVSRN
jgi:hypothetical protein